jgi:putative spermidine/putrescine transport system ATP-binding protein
LLLDEPLSNLDAQLRKEMQVELIELHRKLRLTTIMVTHDQEEALSLSDLLVLMAAGRIEQSGSPRDVYNAPKTLFAATFIGGANLVPVRLYRQADGRTIADLGKGAAVELPSGAHSTDRASAHLLLRQEDLTLSREPRTGEISIAATVLAIAYQGALSRVVVEIGQGHRVSLQLSTTNTETLCDGAKVWLVWPKRLTRLI